MPPIISVSEHFSEVSGMTNVWLILSLLLLKMIFLFGLGTTLKKIDTLYHTDLMLNKMRSIYLALKQKVIKFLMAFTLYGQLFGSALTVLSPAKNYFHCAL